jgi:rubrerythrin
MLRVSTVDVSRGGWRQGRGDDLLAGCRRVCPVATDEDRDRLADQLKALPVRELLAVLRRVLPSHVEESDGLRTTLALATATVDEANPDGIAMVTLVAWPDREYYDSGLGPDQGLWEDGRCQRCGFDVSSNAKRAYCPVCGSKCELT